MERVQCKRMFHFMESMESIMYHLEEKIKFRIDKRHVFLFFMGGVTWTFLTFFMGMLVAGAGKKRSTEQALSALGWLDHHHTTMMSFKVNKKQKVAVIPAKSSTKEQTPPSQSNNAALGDTSQQTKTNTRSAQPSNKTKHSIARKSKSPKPLALQRKKSTFDAKRKQKTREKDGWGDDKTSRRKSTSKTKKERPLSQKQRMALLDVDPPKRLKKKKPQKSKKVAKKRYTLSLRLISSKTAAKIRRDMKRKGYRTELSLRRDNNDKRYYSLVIRGITDKGTVRRLSKYTKKRKSSRPKRTRKKAKSDSGWEN